MKPQQLDIGIRAESQTPFELPEGVLALATAILGMRGSGKTTTAAVMVEEAIRLNHPVVVIDPLDCWWGLRSSLDGKKEAHPVLLFGGTHADLPLEEPDAKAIADLLIEHPWPAVLSLRALSKQGQRRFVANFLEHLYLRKGEPDKRTPLLVVIDEVSTFAPQNVSGASARSLGAIEDLVRRGRTSGFGVVLIDQRAASVSKDLLSQVELLIAHRHKGPHDRKALQEWVRAHDPGDRGDAFMATLATLGVGETWMWFPGSTDIFERVKVRMRHTWDSSGTPDQSAASIGSSRQAMARPDADVWRRRMESARPAPEGKAVKDNPAATSTGSPSVKALEARLTQIMAERDAALRRVQELEDLVAGARLASENLTTFLAAEGNVRAGIPTRLPVALQPKRIPKEVMDAVGNRTPVRPPMEPETASSNGHSDSRTRNGYDRILIALAQCTKPITIEALGLRTALSHKTGSFGQHLAKARRDGLIEGDRSSLQLTDAGRTQMGDVAPLPTGSALAAWWKASLKGTTANILDVLLQAREPLTKEQIGAALGLSAATGSFGQHLAKLRRLELISGPGDAMVASDELKD